MTHPLQPKDNYCRPAQYLNVRVASGKSMRCTWWACEKCGDVLHPFHFLEFSHIRKADDYAIFKASRLCARCAPRKLPIHKSRGRLAWAAVLRNPYSGEPVRFYDPKHCEAGAKWVESEDVGFRMMGPDYIREQPYGLRKRPLTLLNTEL